MAPTRPAGTYLGVVQALDGARAKVQVHHLSGDGLYRARILLSPGLVDADLGATDAPADEGTVALRPLQVGDTVAVTFIEGRTDEVLVIGRVA